MSTHKRDGQPYALDLCVPAYNESKVIVETVRTLSDVLSKSAIQSWRIIVADNCSTDGTGQLAKDLAMPHVIVQHVAIPGKGRVIREVARRSDAAVFGFTDADLSANPAHIGEFYAKVQSGADLVIGSRLVDTTQVNRGFMRTASSKAFNLAAQTILGVTVRDTQCGLKLMNSKVRALLNECKQDTWFLDLELLARAQRENHTICEVPVEWEEFRYANRSSKISALRDGPKALYNMVVIRNDLHR